MGQANNSPTLKTRVVRALTPHEPCIHRMCVIAEGLGSLHKLAHAAGRGHM